MLSSLLMGQSFQAEMVRTLKVHEDSENAFEQLKGLEQMEAMSKAYPKEWLPNFWAAYQCTQMAMLKNRAKEYPKNLDPKELLERSEQYLAQAFKLAEGEADYALKADFHALNSLIYSFRQTYSKDSLSYFKFKALEQQAWKTALTYATDTPVIKVFTATSIGRSKEATLLDLLAAVELLKHAKTAFESYKVRALTTNFNQEWVPFWLPWLEKRLQQHLETEEQIK